MLGVSSEPAFDSIGMFSTSRVEEHQHRRASRQPVSAVRYRLFGSLAVSVDGVDHTLTQRRERNVLAMLVANHGRPVSAERLADQLWGEDPPARAAASLQVVISQLRGVLEPGRARRAPAARLVSSAAGYALRAEPEAVDVWRFEAEARHAIAATAADCVDHEHGGTRGLGRRALRRQRRHRARPVRGRPAAGAAARDGRGTGRRVAPARPPRDGDRRSCRPGRGPSVPGTALVKARHQPVPDPAPGRRPRDATHSARAAGR